jgi:hypothetical protein
MSEDPELPLIDRDELKHEIAAAVRAVIQEQADELGITYEASIDLFFGSKSQPGRGRPARASIKAGRRKKAGSAFR